MIVLLTCLMGFTAPALAAPEDSAQVEIHDAAEYAAHLSLSSSTLFQQYMEQMTWLGSVEDEQVFDGGLQHVVANINAAVAQFEAMPGWRGDTALRDTLVEYWSAIAQHLRVTVPELREISLIEAVTDADLARTEALSRQLDATDAKYQEEMEEVQAAFAVRNNLLLLPAPPTADVWTSTFTAPGVPPAGSSLDGEDYVSFPVRYNNHLTDRHAAMLGQLEGFFEATQGDPGLMEEALVDAVANIERELAEIAAIEPWQGDASLRDGLIVQGEVFRGLLNESYSEYTALMTKRRLKAAEQARVDELIEEGTEILERSLSDFDVVQVAYQERWGVAAWNVWLTSADDVRITAELAAACQSGLADGRGVLLEFSADWCEDCQQLKALSAEPAVVEALARWSVVSVDVGEFDRYPKLQEAFEVERIARWVAMEPVDCAAPAESWPRLSEVVIEPVSGTGGPRTADGLVQWLSAAAVEMRDGASVKDSYGPE